MVLSGNRSQPTHSSLLSEYGSLFATSTLNPLHDRARQLFRIDRSVNSIQQLVVQFSFVANFASDPSSFQIYMFDSVAAQMLLLKCVGDEIWSEATCREAGIPESWIAELCENYESGFDSDTNTIYGEDGKLTNQYRGVSDLILARKLADYIGLDWKSAAAMAFDRRAEVSAIKDSLDEF